MKYIPRKSKYSLSVIKTLAGLGLKTNDDIKRDSFVIEYYGDLMDADDAYKKAGKYLFEINTKWVVNGAPRYNIARYINHSCRPNCRTDIRGKKIFVYAKRNIKAGEELNYDYGKEYFNDFIKSNGCKCSKCLGV